MICHHCRSELKTGRFISRTDECPQCGSDVHACLNCDNYDSHAHNKCREPQAEWVTDRERANFCDFFAANRLSASAAAGSPVADARSKFDSLFKK